MYDAMISLLLRRRNQSAYTPRYHSFSMSLVDKYVKFMKGMNF